jgi:RNA polymerase sigma-70 factor (ECF subfamily)
MDSTTLAIESTPRVATAMAEAAGPLSTATQAGQNLPSDEHLLTRLTAGCEESFTALYRRHQGRVFRFALEMSGSTAVAEEVTQEVFLGVLNGAVRHDPARGRVSSLLMGVARNQVLRSLSRDSRYTADPAEGDRPSREADALANLTRREAIEAVRQAVLSLPPNYREVVVLCDLEEMDYGEAAEALGCPVGTVRSRLHRARALLTGKLRTTTPAARRLA